jgi:hypothetical protein
MGSVTQVCFFGGSVPAGRQASFDRSHAAGLLESGSPSFPVILLVLVGYPGLFGVPFVPCCQVCSWVRFCCCRILVRPWFPLGILSLLFLAGGFVPVSTYLYP